MAHHSVALIDCDAGHQPVVVTAEQTPEVLFGVGTYLLHRPKRRRR